MTGQYEGYLTLLTDLLSPQQLPTGTLTSIAYHIGSLEDAGLANLISAILQSPSLFQDDSDPKASSSSASAASLMNSTLQSDAAIGQTHAVFEAIRQGVLARAANVKAANGTGWSARRKYRKSLEMMLSSAKNNFPLQKPVAALKLAVVSSGTLRALQDLTVKQDKLVSGTGATVVSSITSSTVLALAKAVDCLETSPAVEYTSSAEYAMTAFTISSVVPDIPSDRLKVLATETFFKFGFGYIRSCFDDGHVFQGLAGDLEVTNEGLSWSQTSNSYDRLRLLKGSRTQAILGRFSRSVGKVIESVSSEAILHLLLPHLEAVEGLAERINRDWAASAWSKVTGPEELHPNTRERDEPWSILKTLLFTLTMIFSAVMSLLNTLPISPHRPPSNPVLEMAACALRTFSAIYFVTSKFGMNGFGAYQNVWFGAIDLINRAEPAKVEQIVKTFEPRYSADERRDCILQGTVARSRAIYWFNVIEQVMPKLPETYIADTVVPILRPYLTNKQDHEAFEAAHSVILAAFSKRKTLATSFSGWYTNILLENHPSNLSISQLRFAFATMISCLNELDQETLRLRLEDIERAVNSTSPGPVTGKQAQVDVPLSEAANLQSEVLDNAAIQSPSAQMTPQQLSQASPSILEGLALKSRRGHVLLVLIDQLSSVDLGIMEELLPKVQVYLKEEEDCAPRSSQLALLQVLYNTLSGSMDMIKRETAAKWWLAHRQSLSPANAPDVATSPSEVPQARL